MVSTSLSLFYLSCIWPWLWITSYFFLLKTHAQFHTLRTTRSWINVDHAEERVRERRIKNAINSVQLVPHSAHKPNRPICLRIDGRTWRRTYTVEVTSYIYKTKILFNLTNSLKTYGNLKTEGATMRSNGILLTWSQFLNR